MAIVKESNFPNSRLTAALQAVDINTGNLVQISGESVGTKNALSVQIAQASGNPLVTNANINQYQGLTSFNISNPFVPEGHDEVAFSYTATEDIFTFKKVGNVIAVCKMTYTDATKTVEQSFKRLP